MGKSSQEKIEYAKNLLKIGVPYRQVQLNLRFKFGSGMSNTTLQNLFEESRLEVERVDRIYQLESELAQYKRMYFELLDTMQKLMDNSSR